MLKIVSGSTLVPSALATPYPFISMSHLNSEPSSLLRTTATLTPPAEFQSSRIYSMKESMSGLSMDVLDGRANGICVFACAEYMNGSRKQHFTLRRIKLRDRIGLIHTWFLLCALDDEDDVSAATTK